MSDARRRLEEAMTKLRRSTMQMESTASAIDSHVSRTSPRMSAMIRSAHAVANAAAADADRILIAAEGVRDAAATARQAMMQAATRATLAEAGVGDAKERAGEMAQALEVAKEVASAARDAVLEIEMGQPPLPPSKSEVSVRVVYVWYSSLVFPMAGKIVMRMRCIHLTPDFCWSTGRKHLPDHSQHLEVHVRRRRFGHDGG